MAERRACLTEPELVAWGTRVGREARTPLVLALDGDLGTGKSTLARAIAHGAGVEGGVPSPTFNLLFRYDLPGGAHVHHLDLYRLEREDEVWELGWDELGAGERDLVLIEWAARAGHLLPEPRWDVRMEEAGAPDRRCIWLAPVGGPPELPPLPGETA
jgi:tRNA threonylcarbamoyladenosine biosynthesis protein TsaE